MYKCQSVSENHFFPDNVQYFAPNPPTGQHLATTGRQKVNRRSKTSDSTRLKFDSSRRKSTQTRLELLNAYSEKRKVFFFQLWDGQLFA